MHVHITCATLHKNDIDLSPFLWISSSEIYLQEPHAEFEIIWFVVSYSFSSLSCKPIEICPSMEIFINFLSLARPGREMRAPQRKILFNGVTDVKSLKLRMQTGRKPHIWRKPSKPEPIATYRQRGHRRSWVPLKKPKLKLAPVRKLVCSQHGVAELQRTSCSVIPSLSGTPAVQR